MMRHGDGTHPFESCIAQMIKNRLGTWSRARCTWGEGDNATGSAFLLGYIAGSDHKVITTGRYQDKLTKTDDGWRFRERVYAADA